MRSLRTIFHDNRRVDPVCRYTYDPLYRLIEATGRENKAQSAFRFDPPNGDYRDYPFVGAGQLGDLQALRNFGELYEYDPVGNFVRMIHQAENGNWTRHYAYDEKSLIEHGRKSNRLSRTHLKTKENPVLEPYLYDARGNIIQMPHLPVMRWNFKDELSATSRQVVNEGAAETTHYVYDAGGQRARKITEGRNGSKKNERFYIGGFEVYREHASGGSVTLERQTLHVMDGKQRVALVETQTVDGDAAVSSATPALRHQLSNHLGSACLELDENGGLISYEEYSPYGSTTYQAGSVTEVTLKRYRYTGMERDAENGFTYHSARYYAPWLGRWTSCDPAGLSGGLDLFAYAHADPVRLNDLGGTQPSPAIDLKQDEQGNYILPEQIIEVHGDAPPPTTDESYRRRGLDDNIMTRDEYERQRNFNSDFRTGHKKDAFDEAREAMWITDPEGASKQYYDQLNAEFNDYRDTKAAEIKKGERTIDAAAGFSKGAAVVALAFAAVFTGGFVLGANSASTIGATTSFATSTSSLSLTAGRVVQTVVANPVVGTVATGGAAAVANEGEEAAPVIADAIPAIQTATSEALQFGTNDLVLGLNRAGSLKDVVAQFGGKTYAQFALPSGSFDKQIQVAIS